MNFFEWEINYLVRLIKQKQKTYDKLVKEGKENSMNYFRVARELKALETIYYIVVEEENHLKQVMRTGK